MQCIACSRPLTLRCLEWREDGTCVEHGDSYVMIDGRPVCEACDWHQRQACLTRRPQVDREELTDEDRAAYDNRPGTWDWKQALHEQNHPYLLPGSHGSSTGRAKRFGGQKQGTQIEREAWEA